MDVERKGKGKEEEDKMEGKEREIKLEEVVQWMVDGLMT